MENLTEKQLTSFNQVNAGDKIICMNTCGYDHLLTEGLSYEVISSEPNIFSAYGIDYVTVTTDILNRTVTAHVTRFRKA